MTTIRVHYRQSPAAVTQLDRLAAVAAPGVLGQLKLDLVVWGSCYLTPDGGRVNPPDAGVLYTRPLTELVGPAALCDPVTGWHLAGEQP